MKKSTRGNPLVRVPLLRFRARSARISCSQIKIHTPVTQVTQATTAFVSSSPLPSFVPGSRVACDQIKSRRARARAALLVLRGLVPVSLVFPVPFALAWSLSLLRFPPSEPPQHQARSPWARPPPPCSLVRTCAFSPSRPVAFSVGFSVPSVLRAIRCQMNQEPPRQEPPPCSSF